MTKGSDIQKKKKRKKKGPNIAVVLILTVLLAFITGAAIWGITFYKKLQTPSFNTSTPTPTAPTATPGSTLNPSGTPEPTPPEIIIDTTPKPGDYKDIEWGKDVLNIIVLGYDEDKYRDSIYEYFRTDTMILCTVYFNEKKVVLTSIPRDSYVLIGENFEVKDKINSVPFWAASQGVDTYKAICSTVSRLFGGVPVDYYVAINMDVFEQIIDEIGGVEYDVDVEVAYNGVVLVEKGKQLLNGEKALQYVQFRGTANADIGRTQRQRKFLIATFSEMKSLGTVPKLPAIFNMVKENIQTNFTYTEVLMLANFAATELDAEDISGNIMPGFFLDKNGISYWGINQRERLYYIYELFGITAKAEVQD